MPANDSFGRIREDWGVEAEPVERPHKRVTSSGGIMGMSRIAGTLRGSLSGKDRRAQNQSACASEHATRRWSNQRRAQTHTQTQLMRQNLQRARLLEEERLHEQLNEEAAKRERREELERLNHSVRANNLRSLERTKKRSKSACFYAGGESHSAARVNTVRERQQRKDTAERARPRKQSFVLEFKAMKKEIEAEIRREEQEDRRNRPFLLGAGKRGGRAEADHSYGETPKSGVLRFADEKVALRKKTPLSPQQRQRFLRLDLMNGRATQETRKVPTATSSAAASKKSLLGRGEKLKIHRFMKAQRRKIEEKERLEKSQEVEKQIKIQSNLKKLHSYVRKHGAQGAPLSAWAEAGSSRASV